MLEFIYASDKHRNFVSVEGFRVVEEEIIAP